MDDNVKSNDDLSIFIVIADGWLVPVDYVWTDGACVSDMTTTESNARRRILVTEEPIASQSKQRIVTRRHHQRDVDDDDERAPEHVGQTLLYFWGDQGGVDAPRSGEESGGASVRW